MARTYYAAILHFFDWPGILRQSNMDALEHVTDRISDEVMHTDGCDGEGHVGSSYLGSVMSLYPSGKFYMPWTSNQTNDDVDRDSRFGAALDKAASKHGGWIESGEGDPTDVYFMRYWTLEELQANAFEN